MAKEEIKNQTGTGASAATPAPAKAEVMKEEETVQVKKSDLDAIFKKIEDLSKGQKDLFSVADKSRLARLAEREGGVLIRQVKISRWPTNNQYIVGWKLTKNMSEILPNTNRWIEDQATTLVFEDGTTQEIPLIDFYRSPIKDTADIVATSNNSENGVSYTILTVEFPNGKRLIIDNKFVN